MGAIDVKYGVLADDTNDMETGYRRIYEKRQRVDFDETKYPELIYPDGLFRIILNDKVFFEQPLTVLEFIRVADSWDGSCAMHYNSIETEDNPLISIIPEQGGWHIQSPWQLYESLDIFSTAELGQSLTELSDRVKSQLESINQEVKEQAEITRPIRPILSITERLIEKPWTLAMVPFVYLLISLVLPLFILVNPVMIFFFLFFANHIGVGVILTAKVMAFHHKIAMKHSAFKEMWMTMSQVKKFLRSKNDEVLLERTEALIHFMKWIKIGFVLSIFCLIIAAIATPA